MANIPKAMNPYADEDFKNAMKEAFENWKPTMFEFADEKHINKAVLRYVNPGAWEDFLTILISNGYEVTAKVVEHEIEITWGDK